MAWVSPPIQKIFTSQSSATLVGEKISHRRQAIWTIKIHLKKNGRSPTWEFLGGFKWISFLDLFLDLWGKKRSVCALFKALKAGNLRQRWRGSNPASGASTSVCRLALHGCGSQRSTMRTDFTQRWCEGAPVRPSRTTVCQFSLWHPDPAFPTCLDFCPGSALTPRLEG